MADVSAILMRLSEIALPEAPARGQIMRPSMQPLSY